MNINDIKPDQKINILTTLAGEKIELDGEIASTFKTYILVKPIFLNGKLLGLPKGTKVRVQFVDGSSLYCWDDVEFKTGTLKNEIYHFFEPMGDAVSYNRRNNFRVYIGEVMNMTTFSAEGPMHKQYLIRDISETGFSFVTTDEYDIGKVVRVSIEIRKGMVVPFTAKIVRLQRSEEKSDVIYGCKFSQTNEQLSKYLMNHQVEKQKEKMNSKK